MGILNRCIIFIIIALQPMWLLSQTLHTKSKKAKDYYNRAQNFYALNKTTDALIAVDGAIAKDKSFIEAYLLKADIYQYLRQFDQQKQTLLKSLIIDSTTFIPTFFNIGKAEFNLGNYPESIVWFKKYESKPGANKRAINASEWIAKAEFSIKAKEQGRQIQPINLGANINSEFDEYWPSITADEQTLVCTVLMPKDSMGYRMGGSSNALMHFQEDFYISQLDKQGNWQQRVVILPPLNTDQNEGAQSISADGNWMFFTGCGRPNSIGSCDIYFSQRIENGRSKPVNLGTSINTPFWESQPCFSSDGQTLYFSSNRNGGLGGRDIWTAKIVDFKDDGTPIMGNIKNMGAIINTKGHENSPFIHHDNKTLYFSSDGHQGMGEMDIFMSQFDSLGQWQNPVNLGYPINTRSDEIGLIVNSKGNKAYYSTDGFVNSKGGKDLYSFDLPPELQPTSVSYVKGFVYDSETNQRIGANFELIDLSSGNLVGITSSNRYSGQFLICLPPGQNYLFNVSKSGYLFYSDNFNLEVKDNLNKPKQIDIYLKPIKVGQKIILNNIFYQTNQYQLKAESAAELKKILAFMNSNPEIKIEVQGHTDNVGNDAYNLDLSQKRAKTVVDYLKQNGIAELRLNYKGYGAKQPIDTNETEQGRAKNRRTEMMIVK